MEKETLANIKIEVNGLPMCIVETLVVQIVVPKVSKIIKAAGLELEGEVEELKKEAKNQHKLSKGTIIDKMQA